MFLQLAWIISFISTVLAHIQVPKDFPLYTYWSLVFFLGVIVGVFIVVASDSTQTYHVALVGFLGCGLVLSTSAVNGLIHTSQGAKEAAAAGFILLSMVTVRASHECGAHELLLTVSDCVDLLLWLRPVSRSPRLHRLVRPRQGVDFGQPPDHERRLWEPQARDLDLGAASADVHGST
jgi:hypothetical protein